MRSLNPTKSVNRYTDLVVKFKLWHNSNNIDKLKVHNDNLYGLEGPFRIWLKVKLGITNLDLHLQNLECNTKLNYLHTSIRKYNKL